jgi:DNA-binding beta-propeller fold protein YncE
VHPGRVSLVFAAARGAGKVLVPDSVTCEFGNEIAVGPKPNGLAWDSDRQHLLVADVDDFQARLVDPHTGVTVGAHRCPVGQAGVSSTRPEIDSSSMCASQHALSRSPAAP